MKQFLVIYARRAGKVLSLAEFNENERQDALRTRASLEEKHRVDPDVEVVLLSAESLDELKRTHSRYFTSLSDLAEQPGEVRKSATR